LEVGVREEEGSVGISFRFIRKANPGNKDFQRTRPEAESHSVRWSTFQAGKESHCHPKLHIVPGTILGSSGHPGLNTKKRLSGTFGVLVLPHVDLVHEFIDFNSFIKAYGDEIKGLKETYILRFSVDHNEGHVL